MTPLTHTPTTMNTTDTALTTLRTELATVEKRRLRLLAAIAALTKEPSSRAKTGRNAEIVALRRKGARPVDIALRFGVTPARISQITSSAPTRAKTEQTALTA